MTGRLNYILRRNQKHVLCIEGHMQTLTEKMFLGGQAHSGEFSCLEEAKQITEYWTNPPLHISLWGRRRIWHNYCVSLPHVPWLFYEREETFLDFSCLPATFWLLLLLQLITSLATEGALGQSPLSAGLGRILRAKRLPQELQGSACSDLSSHNNRSIAVFGGGWISTEVVGEGWILGSDKNGY